MRVKLFSNFTRHHFITDTNWSIINSFDAVPKFLYKRQKTAFNQLTSLMTKTGGPLLAIFDAT